MGGMEFEHFGNYAMYLAKYSETKSESGRDQKW